MVPSSALAEDSGSIFLKAGVFQTDTGQRIDKMFSHVDRYSGVASSIGFERDLLRGFALEFEILGWNNSFCPWPLLS